MPTVEHFDFAFEDPERAQVFYKNVFGWSMQKNDSGNPNMEYWHFETAIFSLLRLLMEINSNIDF